MAPTAAAPSVQAGMPQPQTTIEPPGGPFIRHSQAGKLPQYTVSGVAIGNQISQPMISAPGYARGVRLRVAATGGTGTVAVASPDAPFNVFSLVQLFDAYGTPLLIAPGYEALYLIPKWGGCYGLDEAADIKNMPSYSPVATSGNFTFATQLPFEFAKGYGVISMANAAQLPKLTLQGGAIGTVYTTAPTTAPVLEVDNDLDFYWLPEGSGIEPPGLGTTQQWVLNQGNPGIGSNSSVNVNLPREGGYLSTIILIMRDSTGARIDGWGSRVRFIVDGIPLADARFDQLVDDMFIAYPGITRDVGVLVMSRKTSLGQKVLGLLDTGETYLSTNPGTAMQISCSPWGPITNAPASLNVLSGQVIPTGALIQGLSQV